MNYEKIVRIPVERIAVLIGKGGKIKSYIEETSPYYGNINAPVYRFQFIPLQTFNAGCFF